jgi:hypothetical protein
VPDDRIREILTSPLEDKGRRRRADEHTDPDEEPADAIMSGLGPWLIGAVLAGGALALVGYLIAGSDDGPAPTSAPAATTTSTSTTAAPAAPTALPEGYTAAGIHGLRVERILIRTDAVFVTVSSVVPTSVDPETSAAFEGGRWVLDLSDGRSIPSLEQSVDGTAPGFVSVRFALDGTPVTPGEIDAVRLTGLGLRMFGRHEATVELVVGAGEQAEATIQPDSFVLDDGVLLELSTLRASFDQFDLDWSLGGPTDAVASVAPLLDVTAGGQTASIAPVGQGGGFGFFPSLASQPATTSGSFVFIGPEGLGLVAAEDGPTPLSVRVEIPVSWTVYAPADVSLPVDDVPVAVAG